MVQICVFLCDVVNLDKNQQKQNRTSDINKCEDNQTSGTNKFKIERLVLFYLSLSSCFTKNEFYRAKSKKILFHKKDAMLISCAEI